MLCDTIMHRNRASSCLEITRYIDRLNCSRKCCRQWIQTGNRGVLICKFRMRRFLKISLFWWTHVKPLISKEVVGLLSRLYIGGVVGVYCVCWSVVDGPHNAWCMVQCAYTAQVPRCPPGNTHTFHKTPPVVSSPVCSEGGARPWSISSIYWCCEQRSSILTSIFW